MGTCMRQDICVHAAVKCQVFIEMPSLKKAERKCQGFGESALKGCIPFAGSVKVGARRKRKRNKSEAETLQTKVHGGSSGERDVTAMHCGISASAGRSTVQHALRHQHQLAPNGSQRLTDSISHT